MGRGRSLLVGLTGGIGTGKSLALGEFRRAGAQTLSLDEISRELSGPGGAACRPVLRSFGPEVAGPDGGLDREELGRRVFRSPRLRRRLERITHPLILREMGRRLRRLRGGVVVVDVPLLFEAGLERRFDLTVLVAASAGRQLARVMRRDRSSRSQARLRIRSQLPLSFKKLRSDVVVDNNGPKSLFRSRIRSYYQAFRLIAAPPRRTRHGKRNPAA